MQYRRFLRRRALSAAFAIGSGVFASALPAQAHGTRAADPCRAPGVRCVSISFEDAEIRDVLSAFADFSGRSVIAGPEVSGRVTAEIRGQPWDVALREILRAYGLAASEPTPGIIRVEPLGAYQARQTLEPLVTRVFRISYVPVQELAATLQPLVTERGSIATSPSTNALVVTDTEESLARIAALIGR